MATFLGIDIGSRYTKLVEIERKASATLLNYAIFETPYLPQSRLSGQKEINSELFWQEAAKHIPLERIRASRIGINLPSSSITAATLLLPRVAKNEINIIARTEAKRKMIPAAEPSHIFETSVVAERVAANVPRLEVLVARTDNFYLQQLLELFKSINASASIITLTGSSLSTLLPAEVLGKKEVDAACVDIGLHSIVTSVLREGRLNFFRNTAFGISDIVYDITKSLSLPEKNIENAVKENGVPGVSFDLKDKVAVAEEIMRQKYEASLQAQKTNSQEEINLLELRALWQTHIERVIHELRRSLAFYKEQSGGRRIEYLYFLGGGCQIKNLVDLLVKQIGGQCGILLPFKNMQVSAPEAKAFTEDPSSSPIYANSAAIALAIPLKGKTAEVINFLPRELKKKELFAARRLTLLVIITTLILACALSSIGIAMRNYALKTAIKNARARLNKIKDVSESLKDLSLRQQKINQATIQIEEIIKGGADFSAVLKTLANAVGRDILLSRISIYQSDAKVALQTGPGHVYDMTDGQGRPPGIEPPIPIGARPPVPVMAQAALISQMYKLELNAEVFADYEGAGKIIELLRENLESGAYFSGINITPLKLEDIAPQAPGGLNQEISLTLPRARAFTLTADVNINKTAILNEN